MPGLTGWYAVALLCISLAWPAWAARAAGLQAGVPAGTLRTQLGSEDCAPHEVGPVTHSVCAQSMGRTALGPKARLFDALDIERGIACMGAHPSPDHALLRVAGSHLPGPRAQLHVHSMAHRERQVSRHGALRVACVAAGKHLLPRWQGRGTEVTSNTPLPSLPHATLQLHVARVVPAGAGLAV